MPLIKPKELIKDRVKAIQNFHKKAGIKKAELDISGGIDSAVMACLLKMALGSENIILVHSRFETAKAQTDRAKRLANALGIPFINFNGEEVWKALRKTMVGAIIEACDSDTLSKALSRDSIDPTISGSIKSCLRAPIGRGFNRLLGGGIRHGTGNECEDRFIRFYQKGGDGEVDTNPLEMLSKTEVYQLAYALAQDMSSEVREVLYETINAAPSPDLWGNGDGHTDEQELKESFGVPFTYGRIDVKTGKIKSFGTIEMVSRLIDYTTINDLLFGSTEPDWKALLLKATNSKNWTTVPDSDIIPLLIAARKAERMTRHKDNSNIPTLGTREELVNQGILSNDLSKEF